MKKKFLFLIILFLLTGCSNYEMVMEIDKNKSMDFSVTIVSDSVDDNISENIKKYQKKLTSSGYVVDEYIKDDKTGIIISKKFDNIDKISMGQRKDEYNLLYFYSNDYDSELESKMFNVDKGIDTNRYAANFYVDLSNLEIDLTNSVVSFKLYVPNGTESNNATFVSEDGTELIWNITSLGKTEIDFVFELKSYDYIYYGAAILIAIFLVFSIFGNLFTKKEESKGSVSSSNFSGYTNNNYDIDKKIENITRNAVNKNYNPNYNNNNSSNVVNEQKNVQTVEFSNQNVSTEKFNKPLVDEQTLNRNMNINSNSLVPEVDMASFKAPVASKKKGLFSKFSKKSNDKNTSSEAVVNRKIEDNFSAMVDNINHSQFGSSTITINSQIVPVNDIKNDLQDTDDFNTINNFDVGNNESNINNDNNNMNKVEVIANPNLDINNINPEITSINSIQYNDTEQEENESTSTNEVNDTSSVIRINNASVTLDNKKNENL